MEGSCHEVERNGLSLLVSESTNLGATKHFYVESSMQLVREADGGILVNIAGMPLALYETDADSANYDRFNPFRVGLDHLALTVENSRHLRRLKRDLDAAEVPTMGLRKIQRPMTIHQLP